MARWASPPFSLKFASFSSIDFPTSTLSKLACLVSLSKNDLSESGWERYETRGGRRRGIIRTKFKSILPSQIGKILQPTASSRPTTIIARSKRKGISRCSLKRRQASDKRRTWGLFKELRCMKVIARRLALSWNDVKVLKRIATATAMRNFPTRACSPPLPRNHFLGSIVEAKIERDEGSFVQYAENVLCFREAQPQECSCNTTLWIVSLLITSASRTEIGFLCQPRQSDCVADSCDNFCRARDVCVNHDTKWYQRGCHRYKLFAPLCSSKSLHCERGEWSFTKREKRRTILSSVKFDSLGENSRRFVSPKRCLFQFHLKTLNSSHPPPHSRYRLWFHVCFSQLDNPAIKLKDKQANGKHSARRYFPFKLWCD